MNKLSKFIPVVNFCCIEFTLSKVWYKSLTFDFLNLCLGEFVTKELATIQYCSPSRHFGWKTGNFMFQKCEFGQNVNLGKSNWQITGYPASLRKIDAAALNCNLHPKRWSILKLKIWLDFAQSGGTSVGKRVQLCHWFELLSPPAPNACDSLDCDISPSGDANTYARLALIAIWHICGFKPSLSTGVMKKHNFSW